MDPPRFRFGAGMNAGQRRMSLALALVIAAAAMFPPWEWEPHVPADGPERCVGWAFLLARPRAGGRHGSISIDWDVFSLELFAVVCLYATAWNVIDRDEADDAR